MNAEFKRIRKENTFLSSIICFMKILHLKKYKKGEITKGFNKLVLKSDYELSDREALLNQMWSI